MSEKMLPVECPFHPGVFCNFHAIVRLSDESRCIGCQFVCVSDIDVVTKNPLVAALVSSCAATSTTGVC